MDAFGHQELLESLSQASGGSRGSTTTASHTANGSGSQSQQQQHSSHRHNHRSSRHQHQHHHGDWRGNGGSTDGHPPLPHHQQLPSQGGGWGGAYGGAPGVVGSTTGGRSLRSHHQWSSDNDGGGGGGGGSRSHHTHHSSTHNTALTHVDEAYRRLGQRLSLQAHGDALPPPSHRPQCADLFLRGDVSAFGPYDPQQSSSRLQLSTATATTTNNPENSAASSSADPHSHPSSATEPRTHKLPRTNYADHGDHHSSLHPPLPPQQQQSEPGSTSVVAAVTTQHSAPRPIHPPSPQRQTPRVGGSLLLQRLTVHAGDKFQDWYLTAPPPPSPATSVPGGRTGPGTATAEESSTTLTSSDRTPLEKSSSSSAASQPTPPLPGATTTAQHALSSSSSSSLAMSKLQLDAAKTATTTAIATAATANVATTAVASSSATAGGSGASSDHGGAISWRQPPPPPAPRYQPQQQQDPTSPSHYPQQQQQPPPHWGVTNNANNNSHNRRDEEGESSDDSWGYPRHQMALSSSFQRQQQQQHHQQQYPTQHQQQFASQKYSLGPPTANPNSKGLLSSVMEGHCENASVSSTAASGGPGTTVKSGGQGGGGAHGDRSHQSMGSRTISTKESGLRHPSPHKQQSQQQQHSHQHQAPPPRGPCLTAPSEPVANHGCDNVEGNLLVYDGDSLRVPSKSVKTLHGGPPAPNAGDAEYRVVGLLGQGTFAQVFECVHVASGRRVALKVVKNKPAYTRQAAVEVDVFRALQDDPSSAGGGASHDSDRGSLSSKSSSVASARDYMVGLECFFFYKSHLCLVFELLGHNLYEVLKRRQFRGLPLPVVRGILRQALVGVKDLGSKSVVHCDLKPENVLLVSERDLHQIVRAGEGRGSINATSRNRPSSAAGVAAGTEGSTVRNADPGDLRTPPRSPGKAVGGAPAAAPKIKLIDFGSACFEGYTSHTYIQSRFYRSPEVLVGLPYDSAIDMWSLGCMAAELFLGLPILPGVHEHDQLGRITEMIGKIPDWMLEQGSKAPKYYLKFLAQSRPASSVDPQTPTPPLPLERSPSPLVTSTTASPAPAVPQWRLKSQSEYISSLTPQEIRKKGGQAKLEKQPGNRYFKCQRLVDILVSHGQSASGEDRELLPAFAHFLYGLLDPDPWKRWTAYQAIQHPFLTGDMSHFRKKSAGTKLQAKEENLANLELGYYWQSPWDPSICRRKLLSVQRLREKQLQLQQQQQLSMRPTVSSGRPSDGDFSFLHRSDRRRTIQVDSTSPASLLPTRTPMDDNLLPGKFPVRSIQLTGSSSVAAAPGEPNVVHQPPLTLAGPETTAAPITRRTVAAARPPLSLATDVFSGLGSDQQPAATVPMTGPKSFAGDSDLVAYNADFAYALQRPGVVPGPGSVVGDSMSVSSAVSVQRHEVAKAFADGSAHGLDLFSSGKSVLRSSATPTTHPLTQSSSLMSNQSGRGGASMSGQDYSSISQSIQFSNQNRISMAGGVPSSDASSITMHDTSYSNFLYQQNPNHQPPNVFTHQPSHVLQNQQMQQLQHQQQVPQHSYGYPAQQTMQFLPGQMQTPFQQVPMQQIPMQQQPVYLASAPGGGYYYVTTSATGQPILLQPVAVLDQPANPYAHNPGLDPSFPPQAYVHPNMMPSPMQLPMQAQSVYAPQQYGHDNYNMQHDAMQNHHQQLQQDRNIPQSAAPFDLGTQLRQPTTAFSGRKKTNQPSSTFRGGVSM